MDYDVRGFASASDGTRLFYGVRGHGRSLLLLDGIGCDGWAWDGIQPELSQRYRRRAKVAFLAPEKPLRLFCSLFLDALRSSWPQRRPATSSHRRRRAGRRRHSRVLESPCFVGFAMVRRDRLPRIDVLGSMVAIGSKWPVALQSPLCRARSAPQGIARSARCPRGEGMAHGAGRQRCPPLDALVHRYSHLHRYAKNRVENQNIIATWRLAASGVSARENTAKLWE